MRRLSWAAFSLVEVVIALGIFATGVIVIIALISSSASRSRESMDSKVAYGMAERIRSEVISNAGTALPTLSSGTPLQLVGSRDGDDVRVDTNDGRDAYFLIEVAPATATELLRDPSRGTIGAEINVAWPYRPPGAATASNTTARNSVHYQLLIRR